MPVKNIIEVAQDYDAQDIRKSDYEHVMNILGYFPVIALFSGAIRAIEGAINSAYHANRFETQSEKALGLGAYSDEERQIHAFHARKSYDYMKHSDMNVKRGLVELLLPGIGTIICLCHDLFGGRNKYPAEKGSNLSLVSSFSDLTPLRRVEEREQNAELLSRLKRMESAFLLSQVAQQDQRMAS